RALPALDVDDLNILAFRHRVGEGARAWYRELQSRFRQGRRQNRLAPFRQTRAMNEENEIGRRRLLFRRHCLPDRVEHDKSVAFDRELGRLPWYRVVLEKRNRTIDLRGQAASLQGGCNDRRILSVAGQQAVDAHRRSGCLGAEHAWLEPSVRLESGEFRALPPFLVDNSQLIACENRDDDGSAADHAVPLDAGWQDAQARFPDTEASLNQWHCGTHVSSWRWFDKASAGAAPIAASDDGPRRCNRGRSLSSSRSRCPRRWPRSCPRDPPPSNVRQYQCPIWARCRPGPRRRHRSGSRWRAYAAGIPNGPPGAPEMRRRTASLLSPSAPALDRPPESADRSRSTRPPWRIADRRPAVRRRR